MNWHNTKCLTSLKEHNDLGIDTKPEFLPCTIDLDELAAFFFDEDPDGNECTQIKFRSGDSFTVKESYSEFSKLMKAKMFGK